MPARYQAYPEYKESGEEWLGTVPSHWDVVQIKHLSVVKRGASPRPIDDPKYFDEDGEYAWTRIADVTASDVYLTKAPQRLSDLGSSLSVKLEPESLFLSIAGTVGKPCITRMKACIHDGFVYFPELKIPSKFLFYVFAGEQAYKGLGKFGTQLNLNTDTVGGIKIGCTTNDELEGVVQFLDHETAKIDTLIEKQQQLIKLLKEKRQAVISHAVTKGLNPDAPMRDSGVEWLGEVPEHWKILTVRNLIRAGILAIQDGNHGEQHPVAAEYVDEGIPFLMANNVQSGKVSSDDCKYISLDRAEKLRIGFAKPNDVLLTHKGTVGEVGLIPAEIDEPYWMLTPQVTYYRWKHQDYFNKYFYMFFQSVFFQEQLALIGGKQSTRAYVGLVAQGDVFLVVPPQNEQVEIFSKLDRSVSKYDHLIERANLTVKLLNERRTALISAAVTGKIDVRAWQAPEPSNNKAKEAVA